MGLDTTHDCWHGAYSAFMRWREKLAEAAGLPPLELMEGFFDPDRTFWFVRHDDDLARKDVTRISARLPIRWDLLRPDPLYELLHHSDCDGEIPAESCGPIADRLEELLPALDGDGGGHIGSYREKTEQFIGGLRRAAAAGEAVGFG